MADEEVIASVPSGYRWLVLYATLFKRCLACDPMTVGERLELLEALNRMTDMYFTAEALALLAPADDGTIAAMRAAWQLDGDSALSPSFEVLTGAAVFDSLVRANPSILAAIKICTRGQDRAPAPQPSETPQQPATTAASSPYTGPRLGRPAEPQRAGGIEFDLF
jgi:hypothetical protein